MGLLPLLVPVVTGLLIKKASDAKSLKENLEINIEVHGVKFDNITPVINLRIELLNPSAGQVTIKSVGGVITYKDTKIADVFTTEPFSINPRTRKDFILPIRLNVASSILSLFLNMKSKRIIKAKLNFFTSLGQIPYEKELEVKNPF